MHGRHAELLETIEMSGSQRLAAAICESGVRARDAAFLGSAWAEQLAEWAGLSRATWRRQMSKMGIERHDPDR